MRNLLLRSLLVFVVTIFCVVLFAPNFLDQDLQIVFKKEVRLPDGTKETIPEQQIKDFVNDRENGLGVYFPERKCLFEAQGSIPRTHRCVLQGRFITAARINELSQANPDLINDLKTGLLPHPIERLFAFGKKKSKNLKVRLGLDLQGGMRAVFRADYETYLDRLKEKYGPKLEELKKQQLLAKTEKDKKDIAERVDYINDRLNLDDLRKHELLNDAQDVITKRLISLNLSEPEVRVQEDSFSIGVDMPGVTNSSFVLRKLKDTVTVEYRIVNDAATAMLNRNFTEELNKITTLYRSGKVDPLDVQDIINTVRRKSNVKPEDGRIFLLWRRGAKKKSVSLPREFRVLGPPVLDGDDMTNAGTNIHPSTGRYRINFELGAAGASTFCEITTKQLKKRLAILWGDRVVSDPVIQSPICGGNGVIDGDFDKKEADEVAAVIREGALPLPLELLSVSFIGPSLGQESIMAGIVSIALGFLLVMIFMFGYYKLSGIVANLALLMNLLMIAAVLSLLEFTLTLPGFAGIILTAGMAIDANVIIFEKIKEELRAGMAPSIAVESGYNASFWTILDANVTTLIAAVVLWKVGFQFGDSAIQGFSITLFFGLLSSMFTALFVSRLIFDWFLHLNRGMKSFSIGYGFGGGKNK